MKATIRLTLLIITLITLGTFLSSCEKYSSEKSSNKITINGEWKYEMSYSGSRITTTVMSDTDGMIKNNRSTKSGSLRLKLFLTSSKYNGGDINGYVMADYLLDDGDPLEGGHYYHSVIFSDTEGFPPYGEYYVTLVLLEYDGEYYIEDYLNFSKGIKVYSTKNHIDFQEEKYNKVKCLK